MGNGHMGNGQMGNGHMGNGHMGNGHMGACTGIAHTCNPGHSNSSISPPRCMHAQQQHRRWHGIARAMHAQRHALSCGTKPWRPAGARRTLTRVISVLTLCCVSCIVPLPRCLPGPHTSGIQDGTEPCQARALATTMATKARRSRVRYWRYMPVHV